MKVVDKYLYMGTTWGCLIVVDAENLHLGPYTVFRCHSSEDFRIILSLHETEHEGIVPGIITIGNYLNKNQKYSQFLSNHDSMCV
jgi:hypothetical protein